MLEALQNVKRWSRSNISIQKDDNTKTWKLSFVLPLWWESLSLLLKIFFSYPRFCLILFHCSTKQLSLEKHGKWSNILFKHVCDTIWSTVCSDYKILLVKFFLLKIFANIFNQILHARQCFATCPICQTMLVQQFLDVWSAMLWSRVQNLGSR